ncbi:MAG: prephenate dehydrogenase/arogenate dehydrogenase family protein [Anaerolineae bacterium]
MNITIVGLGLVGTSIGLALRAATQEIPVTGHDPDPLRVSRAKKLGAIQKSHWNLPAACEDADLVLLALPLPELEKTLAALGGALRENTVVLDTAPLKRPVMAWAAQHLPASTQFIGGHPVLQGLPGAAEPSADLLQGARFYLVAPAGASARAVALAANLAAAVGAEARFTDAIEHDGLMAATRQLPLLITLALLETLQDQPGWEDRLASLGGELASLAASLGQPEAAMEISANADHVAPWLDALAARLTSLRGAIHAGTTADLSERLARAAERYEAGLRAQSEQPDERGEVRTEGWRSFLLGGLGRRG